jgi:hypothetical protein
MSTAAYPIDLDHPNAFEFLSIIVDEFEKAALRSEKRSGILVVTKGPLSAMDQILDGSEKTLLAAKQSAKNNSAPPPPPPNAVETGATTHPNNLNTRVAVKSAGSPPQGSDAPVTTSSTPLGVNVVPAEDNNDTLLLPPEVTVEGGAGFDADLMELMKGKMKKKAGNKLEEAIEDCLGCDLSLKFDWQLKPFNLLGPIADMLSEINAALDKLGNMLNPLNVWKDFCGALNDFSLICIKDWVAILMALKMLLKKYLTFNLELRVDWSVILGPILKLIVEAFLSLVEELAGLVVAPLDCAIAVLASFEELERAAKELGALAADFPKGIANQTQGIANQFGGRETANSRNRPVGTNGLTRTAEWIPGTSDNKTTAGINEWQPGRIRASTQVGKEAKLEAKENSLFQFPTGAEAVIDVPLDQRLGDRDWLDSSIFNKLGDSVREARQFILDLVRKLQLSFRSLNGLVAGGLSIQIGNLGVLLIVKDLISMVTMIIKMLQNNKNIKDWCKLLEEDPNAFANSFNGQATLSRDVPSAKIDNNGNLVLSAGPRYTTPAVSCVNARSQSEASVLNQWINELNRNSS